MDSNTAPPFIFYLCHEEALNRNFYLFDELFKQYGYVLVPVKIDQLQILAASADQDQLMVISSVTNSSEFAAYNQKIRPLLKYVLKSKRISFIHLSSFSKLNDTKVYSLQKNYYFLKFPMNASELAEKIIQFHIYKQEQRTLWPGGKRSNAVRTV